MFLAPKYSLDEFLFGWSVLKHWLSLSFSRGSVSEFFLDLLVERGQIIDFLNDINAHLFKPVDGGIVVLEHEVELPKSLVEIHGVVEHVVGYELHLMKHNIYYLQTKSGIVLMLLRRGREYF